MNISRFWILSILMISFSLSSVPLSRAAPTLNELPTEILMKTLLNSSVEELDQAARSYKFLRDIILSKDFYRISKRTWLKKGNYQNLVDFPQYLILRQVKKKFKHLEWRKRAVRMLLNAKTQFAEIPAGTFQMGDPSSNSKDFSDNKTWWVTLSHPTWIQRVQFTQLLMVLVTGKNDSYFNREQDCPEDHMVIRIRREDNSREKISLCPRNPAERNSTFGGASHAKKVIKILKNQFGIHTRLPTEAEWERAARGPSTVYEPSDLKAHAWYNENSGDRPHRVATKKPNPFGLFDMNGNVWEWVADLYHHHTPSNDESTLVVDPLRKWDSSMMGFVQVIRGGSWANAAYRATSTYRTHEKDEEYDVGFRLVRILE